jgi:ComF family protein
MFGFSLARGLVELAFPPACPACDALCGSGEPLCPRCATSLYEVGPACPRCAEPASVSRSMPCRRCLRRPPPWVRALAAFRYGGELGLALRRLKLENRPDIARTLAPLFAAPLAAAAERAELAVPVPLSWRRLAGRTFNQSQVLLAHAARGLILPTRPAALRRVRDTPSQAGLGVAARRANVAGAFAVPASQRRHVAGRRVLLVDDIMTTGATLAAAARALIEVGAAEVSCFAFARAETA